MSIAPDRRIDSSSMGESSYQEKKRQQPIGMTISSSRLKSYRLHFSCDYTGRYRRHTKRQIQWRFGLTNLAAVRQGKRGSECRGEEHEVKLVWSVKSGKTRVFWNKSNISHLFPQKNSFDFVTFEWESRGGEKFQIVAHADPIHVRPQYDFLINGESFFTLPHVSALGESDELSAVQEDRPTTIPNVESSISGSVPPSGDVKSGDSIGCECENVSPSEDLSFRLKMAGFGSSEAGPAHEVEDELTSELYSNTLESLRHTVTACIPETEEMVSRAIINAFSDDRDSQNSFDSSSFDSEIPSPFQIQADVLADTYQWIELNVDFAPRPDVEDQKLSFMQKQVEAMFSHVRHDRLDADEAARILINVAISLAMKLKIPVPKDTIVLSGLPKEVAAGDLLDALCDFGEVDAVAISKGRQLGVCRFLNEVGPTKACVAADADSLSVCGAKLSVWLLSSLGQRSRVSESRPRAQSLTTPRVEKPKLAVRQRSHQRNTMSIETLFQGSAELGAQICIEPMVVTPDEERSVLRPNVFSNIPANSNRPMYGASGLDLSGHHLVSPDHSWHSPQSMLVRD